MITGLCDLFQSLPMTDVCMRKTHRCFTPSSKAISFNFQPNMLLISMISKTKQTGCGTAPTVLSYHVASMGFFSLLICTLKSSHSLSPPISHVHKRNTLNLEQNVFSAATIVMFLHESSRRQSGGVRQDEGRERHVGALQSRREQCYGKSTLRLHFWKTDLWVITLNS